MIVLVLAPVTGSTRVSESRECPRAGHGDSNTQESLDLCPTYMFDNRYEPIGKEVPAC